jgi:hypothetical protein
VAAVTATSLRSLSALLYPAALFQTNQYSLCAGNRRPSHLLLTLCWGDTRASRQVFLLLSITRRTRGFSMTSPKAGLATDTASGRKRM